MSTYPSRPVLVAAIGSRCPYCGEPMACSLRHPSRDHIRPRSRGHALTADNQAVVCRTCNTDKGSLSLGRWLNRLRRAADPRAGNVADFMRQTGIEVPG
ncbi:HNH endonuclease [uncultured Reyranella sp.]|uniref:HNH endonuclease n=1 Tax=uncultured Reyranella sp. TaxID=735512 RepID=UPI0025D45E12|nr:HNH endonuclease [uncultured Reyranella sp.]